MNTVTLDQTNPSDEDGALFSVKVWDLPTRLFHWVLVVLVTISYLSAKAGGTAMTYHIRAGVLILVLLVFRVAWGVVGSRESRFRAFVRGPRAVWRHAAVLFEKDAPRHLGHNPMGGWSVLAMLAAMLVQTATGLFASDDILTQGPLYYRVGMEASRFFTGIHHLNKIVLAALICLHIGAIGFYHFYKKENLSLAMFTGVKQWPHHVSMTPPKPWLAAVILALAALLVPGALYLFR